MVLGSSTGE